MSLPVFKNEAFTRGHENSVNYGFYGRQGGVGHGVYASLNCGLGSDDDPQNVAQNRLLVQQDLGPGVQALTGPYQVHSNLCVQVNSPWKAADRPKADAVVTTQKNLAISVVTADCAPVLFFAPSSEGAVIGAAHAGWRGALSGVLEATLAAMQACRPVKLQDIHACVGPCIGQDSYEIGPEFKERVLDADQHYERFFRWCAQTRSDYFDQQGFCLYRLEQAGLTRISALPLDTYTQKDRFFSYRRATHNGEKPYGRQISAIALV